MDLGFRGGFAFRGNRFKRQPFEIVRAYDFDLRCVETYRLNISEHIEEVALNKVEPEAVPGADVLIGGFPCQDFSSCGPKKGLTSAAGNSIAPWSTTWSIIARLWLLGRTSPT